MLIFYEGFSIMWFLSVKHTFLILHLMYYLGNMFRLVIESTSGIITQGSTTWMPENNQALKVQEIYGKNTQLRLHSLYVNKIWLSNCMECCHCLKQQAIWTYVFLNRSIVKQYHYKIHSRDLIILTISGNLF